MAGCSSTSDVAAPTFADVDAAAVAMQAKYTDANGDLLVGVDRASGAEINSAANATYTGYVGGDVAGSTLVGTLEVAADFTALTTASSATGFIHETDGDYAGTLSGAGVIAPSAPLLAPQISTTVAGTLVNGGVNYATSLALDGQFVENAADPVGAIAGTADGVVGTDLLIGTFAAEK
jgi:hypothetical protein